MFTWQIKYRDRKPLDVAIRKWNQWGKDAHGLAARYWQSVLLPRHFLPDAFLRYKHQPRRPTYLRYKARRWRNRAPDFGRIDNLYSGKMSRMLRASGTVVTYPSRFTVRMVGPQYVTMRVFTGNRQQAAQQGWRYGRNKQFSQTAGQQPDKRKELLTDTRDEQLEMLKIVSERLALLLRTYDLGAMEDWKLA